jgi:4a-hydroxytetrahydrobiopterin dehydratase
MSLTLEEVDLEIARQHGWRRHGDELVRELRLRDFEDALRFVERIAEAAVDYKRRPDMCISEFNHVRLTVANRHHAGFTRAEMRLLAKVNAILDEHHPDAVSH